MKAFLKLLVLVGFALGIAHPALAALPGEVTSITPGNGATNVPQNTTVSVVFSVDMDNTTINATNLYLKLGGSGTAIAASVSYDSTSRTAVLTPSANLTNNASYTVFVTRSIKTSAGVRINGGSTYTEYSFTIEPANLPPTVNSTTPASGATGVSRTSRATATFSEDIKLSTLTSSTFYMKAGATSIPGFISYNASTFVATFTPTVTLAYSTIYTVTLTTGITDQAGLAMAANKVWSFTTMAPDTTPPTVTSVTPAADATGVSLTPTLSAVFSEDINEATLTSASFTVGGVAGTVAYNAASRTATFTPSAPLARETIYTATLSSAVTDVAGNALTPKSWSFTTVGTFPVTATPMNNYCQTPPFVTSGAASLKPNVLLIVDNSGSMYEFAYKTPGTGDSSFDTSYNSATSYYGYFDPTKMYAYSTTSGGYFLVDSTKTLDTTKFSATSGFSGNMLNWLTMRRVDIVRKVLVGGKTQPRSAGVANYLFPSNDPDRNYYKSYGSRYYEVSDKLYVCGSSSCNSNTASYNLKVYVGDQLPQEGLLLQMNDRINFGIMNFNGGYKFEDNQNSTRDGGQVTVDIGATGTNLITQVENTDPSTWTPLGETLYEAVRYFEATTSAYNGGTYSGKDPITASCMKNFVLILTDGESTKDRNLPGTAFTGSGGVTDANFNIKTYMDRIATTDGTTSKWNVSPNSDEGSWYLPGVALYAHTTDLRSATLGKSALPGTQNLTIYTVFAFDDSATGRLLLQQTSKFGGFDDASMSATSVPDSAGKWGKCDASGITDYAHCVPNTYYEAQQGDQLKSALQSAFEDILSKVSSGTSASIVNNRGQSGANLYQAVFYPKKSFDSTDLYWTGELQNLWYYLDPKLQTSSIREDTNDDWKLDLKADRKVTVDYDTTKNQTVANWYLDSTGDGSFTFEKTGTPDDVHALWRAGRLLHYRSPGSRTIKTTLGSYNSAFLSDSNPLASNASDGMVSFENTNGASIGDYLNVTDVSTAKKLIDYVRGVDYLTDTAYRARTATIKGKSTMPAPFNADVTGVWKLGDIISSTPQAQSERQLNDFDSSYSDLSYKDFYTSAQYKKRNMVYTAANDGMLHAFRSGLVSSVPHTTTALSTVTTISNPDNTLNIGDEEWAFVPKNALPYLKYLGDPSYNHLYYVNNTVVLADASINRPNNSSASCTQSSYWKCDKKTTYSDAATKTLDLDNTSWRTILVGGMGLGGASRDYAGFCNKDDGSTPASSAQETRLDCVKSPIAGTGLSSFFALDVTVPTAPKFLWEFSDAVLASADKGLGYATSGPAIVRIASRVPANATHGTPDLAKNGRWFAVFATGPSGPIDTGINQFRGRSDNNLKVYVVDLHPDLSSGWVKNTNYWVFDSGIANAFGGDLSESVIDVDRRKPGNYGYYSDDVVYIGYTRPKTGVTPAQWTDGGVLRLLTNDSWDPADWSLSKVIDGVGPVTSNVTKLEDTSITKKLWLYFGTGRYFYKDTAAQDDPSSQRHLFGVQDVCYNTQTTRMNGGYSDVTGLKQGCMLAAPAVLSFSDLVDQSSTIAASVPATKKGWYIGLDLPGNYAMGAQMTTAAYDAERVVTNTTISSRGVVYYTTFKPTSDLCGYGGSTLLWIVDYSNGGVPPPSTQKGKMLLQLSSGEFISIDLSQDTKGDASQNTRGDRRLKATLSGHGIAGGKGGSLQGASAPVRKILHILEK
jgi:type IV pilus assembly protein PilY1